MGRTAGQGSTGQGPTATSRGPLARLRPVLLGVALALVAAPLVATSALAAAPSAGPAEPVAVVAAADPADPAPYGGLLDAPDPGEEISTEQVLEVSMLALGTLNGLAFGVAVLLSKMRGPSVAATRQALITRTTPGVPSQGRRSRRDRRAAVGAPDVAGPGPAPVSAPSPVVPAIAGAPRPRTGPLRPQTAPDGRDPGLDGPAAAPGAVPAQARAGSGPLPIVPASTVPRRTSV